MSDVKCSRCGHINPSTVDRCERCYYKFDKALSPMSSTTSARVSPAKSSTKSTSSIPKPPIHPLSAIVTIALDGVFDAIEIGSTVTVMGLPLIGVTIIASGVTCFVTVSMIERFVSHKDWGEALALGLGMGVLAAVPYVFLGTAAGTLALGWAGLHKLLPPKTP